MMTGKILVAAEYYLNILRVKVLDKGTGGIIVPRETSETEGYYLSVSYQIDDRFELGEYISDYENNNHKSGPENELREITISARYDINPNWLIKFEIHKMKGLFGVTPENEILLEENWYLFAAKISYNF